MKKLCLMAVVVLAICALTQVPVRAQGAAKKGPEISRDPDLEKDAMHNLEVARQYFTLKKAYVASLQRCEEVLAGNPDFAKIDEVLFIAGQSSLYLAASKGKQEPKQYVIREGEKRITLTADDFRKKAEGYFSQLVVEHPQSAFRARAEEGLKAVGGRQ